MNKAEFFKLCSSAAYGDNPRGFFDLKVKACRDSSCQIGGRPVVELQGCFNGINYRCIYEPHFKDHDYIAAVGKKCDHKAAKFQTWLEEWKLYQDKPMVEMCSECDQVKKWCPCNDV